MTPKEIESVKAHVQALVAEVARVFKAQNDELEMPKDELVALTNQYTTTFANQLVVAREEEMSQAEATMAGNSKADWKSYKKDRKDAMIETRKQLRMFVKKPEEVITNETLVGVDPSAGVVEPVEVS